MRLYNSLTRSKDELNVENNTVKIYNCGPTVYNYIHIGNARCFVIFDMLRRYLKYKGHNVTFIQNFTDVDDKIIRRAAEEKITPAEVAEKYIAEYFRDADGLGVEHADVYPRATENIDGIIKLVSALIERGYAYESNGDVYFSAKKFGEYGKLSHQPLEELEAGARIDVSEIKKDPMDFALWKKKKEGEISWLSPWGEGRPGWHIECSAMINRYLGEQIDMHCGGQDLIFPHHENEIAQSECATGHPLARFWVHNGYINIDNKKMSKSTTFLLYATLRLNTATFPFGIFLLASHYRSPVNYSADALEQATAALSRLNNCSDNLKFRIAGAPKNALSERETESLDTIAAKKQLFIDSMEDDFNTADAIAALFEIVREINTVLAESADCSAEYIQKAGGVFTELGTLLGLLKAEAEKGDEAEIEKLIAERTEAKKQKNYAKADEIRAALKEMGVVLEDTPQGVKWKRI